jgi:aspartyl-tRNA(Asn)/glutamyl-tRNA(Gln) amidotransferase subunit A
LDRISQFDSEIGAFLCVDREQALRQARAADERIRKGESLSELDGIPLGIKDLIVAEGLPTTAGSRILEGYRPPYDATASRKLKEHGAVILGKLNLDEFGMGSTNEFSAYKACRNPYDKTRSPGGSSGGSAAAVAASFCYGSLGTDTGGSVRLPASFCGIVGLKPSYGRVSRFGVVAFASSLDQVGPMARDVTDTAVMLSAIAGFDERDSTSVNVPVPRYQDMLTGDLTGLRVGIPKEYFSIGGLDAEVKETVERAIEALKKRGASVREVSLPHTKHAVATYYIIAPAEASSNLSRYDGVRYGPRLGEEDGLRSLYETTRGRLFGAEVKRRIMIGTYVLSAGYYDAYYVRAQKVRRLFAEDFQRAFQDVDMLVCPTAPVLPFVLGAQNADPLQMYLNDIFTISANLAGLPALSLNAGFSKAGLPIGVQLMGRAFDEAALLNAAYGLEQELQVRGLPKL